MALRLAVRFFDANENDVDRRSISGLTTAGGFGGSYGTGDKKSFISKADVNKDLLDSYVEQDYEVVSFMIVDIDDDDFREL